MTHSILLSKGIVEIFGIFYREVCFGRSFFTHSYYIWTSGAAVKILCLHCRCTGLIDGWGTVIMLCATVKKFGLPMWLSGKEFACNAGDLGSVPGLGRSPGEGNGNPLLYSCLGSPMNRGTWRATVRGVAKSRT